MGRLVEMLSNSRAWAALRRAVVSRLPFLRLESDVADVVYLTWLVPVEACAPLVPAGLRLWQRGGLTPFTVLTYRHAHFGPSLLGPLRKLCPSPLQSNWRLYLDRAPEGAPAVPTVLFLKNVMDKLAYALGARLFSDALPTHLAARFVHTRTGERFTTRIEPGAGSAPALACTVQTGVDEVLSPDFAAAFGSWRGAVEFLACQDAAIAPIAHGDRLALAAIELPIDLASVRPASVLDADCALLAALRAASPPLGFVVPAVRFKVVAERLL